MRSTKHIFYHEISRKASKWEPYFDVYDSYFSKFVDASPLVVEVGVWHGGSLEMWTKYFGQGARIIGIDRDPSAAENPPPGAEVVIGDQADLDFWNSFLSSIPPIDVFVDDGGHHQFQQKITLECVWPHLSENGVYICEDTHTSYQPFYGGTPDVETFMDYAKGLVDLIHRNHHGGQKGLARSHLFGDLKTVHFYDSMVVLTKGRQKFDLVEVN